MRLLGKRLKRFYQIVTPVAPLWDFVIFNVAVTAMVGSAALTVIDRT